MEFKQFAEIFAEALDLENLNKVKIDTKFRDLDDWSSLSSLNLITILDEQLGYTLDGAEIKSSETVGDLYEIIKKKDEGKN